MGLLFMDNSTILIIKFDDVINMVGALCDKRSLDEVCFDILKTVGIGEGFDILHELMLGDSDERILDSKEGLEANESVTYDSARDYDALSGGVVGQSCNA